MHDGAVPDVMEPDGRLRAHAAAGRGRVHVRDAEALVERLVFWVLNMGLAVFVVGLVADSADVKRVGAPVMGVAILVGVALFGWRLWQGRAAGNPVGAPA